MEDLMAAVGEFQAAKALMEIENNGLSKHQQHNVIVEYDDGSHSILHPRIDNLTGPFSRIETIQRITFFLDGQEYEFVACQ